MHTDHKPAKTGVAWLPNQSDILSEAIEGLTALGDYLAVAQHRCRDKSGLSEVLEKSISQYQRICDAIRQLRRLADNAPAVPFDADRVELPMFPLKGERTNPINRKIRASQLASRIDDGPDASRASLIHDESGKVRNRRRVVEGAGVLDGQAWGNPTLQDRRPFQCTRPRYE